MAAPGLRTSDDMRALEAPHGLYLGERNLDLVGRRTANFLDRKLAAGRNVADEVDEREASLAEQADERIRSAIDLQAKG